MFIISFISTADSNSDESEYSSDDDSVDGVVDSFFRNVYGMLTGRGGDEDEEPQIPIAEESTTEKFVPFHQWSHIELENKKYTHIGHIYPGDFIGHVGMMNRAPHAGTVRAIETCIVYSL